MEFIEHSTPRFRATHSPPRLETMDFDVLNRNRLPDRLPIVVDDSPEHNTRNGWSVFCDVVLWRVAPCLCWRGASVLMRAPGGTHTPGLGSVWMKVARVAKRDLFLKFSFTNCLTSRWTIRSCFLSRHSAWGPTMGEAKYTARGWRVYALA